MEIHKFPKLNSGLFSFGRSPLNVDSHKGVDVDIRDPKPFKCTIKPRSEGAIKLVEETYGRGSC